MAAALWRPTPVMRGALVAAATLALFGVVYMRITPFAPILMFTPVLVAPVAYAMARVPGVLLAQFVWVFPYLLGHGDLANLAGIAGGAAGAWVVGRVRRRYGHLWRPPPPLVG